MNISIRNPDALESRIRKNQALWNLNHRPLARMIIVMLLISVWMLYIDIAEDFTIKEITSPKATIYDLHLSFSIGLAFLLCSFFLLYIYLRNRRYFTKERERLMYKYESNNLFPIYDLIEINDEGVTESTVEYKFEIKWMRFTHYKEYKDFLFLVMNSQIGSSIVIDKNVVDSNDYQQILGYIKSRLQKMK